MKRHIPILLLIHLVIFPAPPCAATSGLNISKVVHISHKSNWWDAQAYCRRQHSDLVTIRNEQEAEKLASYHSWIGLRRRQDGVWKWSRGDETASFIFWALDETHHRQRCVWKESSLLRWKSDECTNHHPFLCADERLILVQEMKTWEEALLHCRELQAVHSTAAHTTHLYDLASLPEATNVLWDREKIGLEATTDEVWVGLRFLAGQWWWLSREAVTSSYLPHCPAQEQHCGAMVHSSTDWKIMNCTEKRNFLCSRNP